MISFQILPGFESNYGAGHALAKRIVKQINEETYEIVETNTAEADRYEFAVFRK